MEWQQDLTRLVRLYEVFQKYVEQLAGFSKEEVSVDSFQATHEATRLRFEEESYRFREWKDGEEVLNDAIFTLIRSPDECRDPQAFRILTVLATVKFEHLFEKARNKIEEIHQRLSVLVGQCEAEAATHFTPEASTSTAKRIDVWDHMLETGFKWGGGGWYNLAPGSSNCAIDCTGDARRRGAGAAHE